MPRIHQTMGDGDNLKYTASMFEPAYLPNIRQDVVPRSLTEPRTCVEPTCEMQDVKIQGQHACTVCEGHLHAWCGKRDPERELRNTCSVCSGL
jgi:hypothetical protein